MRFQRQENILSLERTCPTRHGALPTPPRRAPSAVLDESIGLTSSCHPKRPVVVPILGVLPAPGVPSAEIPSGGEPHGIACSRCAAPTLDQQSPFKRSPARFGAHIRPIGRTSVGVAPTCAHDMVGHPPRVGRQCASRVVGVLVGRPFFGRHTSQGARVGPPRKQSGARGPAAERAAERALPSGGGRRVPADSRPGSRRVPAAAPAGVRACRQRAGRGRPRLASVGNASSLHATRPPSPRRHPTPLRLALLCPHLAAPIRCLPHLHVVRVHGMPNALNAPAVSPHGHIGVSHAAPLTAVAAASHDVRRPPRGAVRPSPPPAAAVQLGRPVAVGATVAPVVAIAAHGHGSASGRCRGATGGRRPRVGLRADDTAAVATQGKGAGEVGGAGGAARGRGAGGFGGRHVRQGAKGSHRQQGGGQCHRGEEKDKGIEWGGGGQRRPLGRGECEAASVGGATRQHQRR
ncbi:hypothetical protein BU14_0736s0004 [Porphyra umbilicalis]|uniref:Uncharacterized protein n=1 Tax=Porphyra umbilicalis TaxID=2786 RepID=A0A1X6NPI6_PORUM|nr:hypothetical protein BU14_0736s0004 [Porphyra umbilicalis]|eukprot:OSX70511.1 hypothetical protein BU14_0736s0004 [Porphyra umbilicalis]